MSKDDAIKRLEALGKKGLVVSISYGPYSGSQQYANVEGAVAGDLLYSVDVLWPDGRMFRKPYACKTFAQTVDIAEAAVDIAEEEDE